MARYLSSDEIVEAAREAVRQSRPQDRRCVSAGDVILGASMALDATIEEGDEEIAQAAIDTMIEELCTE